MRSMYSLALLASGLLIVQPAHAQQPITQTLSTEVEPVIMGGMLRGCALNFEVGRQDPEFNQGEFTYITGSLNFYLMPGQEPTFVLKLGVKSDAGGGFVAPAEAFLVQDNRTNQADFRQSLDGEVDGLRLFVFKAGDETLDYSMGAIAQSGSFSFSYSMVNNGLNAIVPVDLSVENLDLDNPSQSVLSSEHTSEWVECFGSAIEGAAR